MAKIFTPLFLFLLITAACPAQDAERDFVADAVKHGNAKALASYFTAGVNLTVDRKDEVYSREQAEVIMTRFFANHVPRDFSIRHEGKSKMDDHYYIGDLVTGNGNYRVTFFMKREQDGFRIRQLRIEED